MSLLEDPRHEAFLVWLTTIPKERDLKTYAEIAASLGVAPRTLRDWKVRPEFHKEWTDRAIAIGGDPERTQRVLDALFEKACDPDSAQSVQAAKAWADIAGVIKPPKLSEATTSDLASMPTEDLEALFATLMAKQTPSVGA
jgi:hypothetical protein